MNDPVPSFFAKMIFKETGFLRGLKALAHLNKKGGFDCPSCAWPDPDDERSRIGEYCENGQGQWLKKPLQKN